MTDNAQFTKDVEHADNCDCYTKELDGKEVKVLGKNCEPENLKKLREGLGDN